VDINETMLRRLREKFEDRGVDYGPRLTIYKDNIARLDGFPPSSFDAAIMTNVLYAIDDRDECLRNVNRILKDGGVLSLSTSHRETDVDRLFDAMQEALKQEGRLDEHQEQVEIARDRHKQLEAMIHSDTIDDTVRRLKEAGFAIEGRPQTTYVGAVVVIKARKVGDPGPKTTPSAPEAVVGPGDDGRDRDVFFSYSYEDRDVADKLVAALDAERLNCFDAHRDISPSSDWVKVVTEAIGSCRVMLLILSEHASGSDFVRREVAFAVQKKIPIIPFRVAEVAPSNQLAFFINDFHWLDAFPGPLEGHIPRLLDTVRSLLASTAAPMRNRPGS
jgi:SAM-dependent methyltransferase